MLIYINRHSFTSFSLSFCRRWRQCEQFIDSKILFFAISVVAFFILFLLYRFAYIQIYPNSKMRINIHAEINIFKIQVV